MRVCRMFPSPRSSPAILLIRTGDLIPVDGHIESGLAVTETEAAFNRRVLADAAGSEVR